MTDQHTLTRSRVVILQARLPHYRRDFFNALADHCEVVVIHSGSASARAKDRFAEVVVPYCSVGPFRVQRGLARAIRLNHPDIIVAGDDLRWVGVLCAKWLHRRRVPWVWWGLDRSRNKTWEFVKLRFIVSRSDQAVFYDSETMKYCLSHGVSEDHAIVANNTVHVPNARSFHSYPAKNCFINVGTLDKRKRNDVLIRIFKGIRQKTGLELKLVLVGDGPEREFLMRVIEEEGLERCVTLTGRIEDPLKLEKYYKEAIASVSFGQAGLAVLQSMAFGVPFVTARNAISGGEITNIVQGLNGILCEDNAESLEKCLVELASNTDRARELGRNASEHYMKCATIDNMVRCFLVAMSRSVSEHEARGRNRDRK